MGNDTKIKADTIAVENNNKAKTLDNVLGNLSDLNTSDKSNLVNAINSNIPKVLYESSNGSNGNIILSDSIANYTYVEVFYRNNDNNYNSKKFYNINGKNVVLDSYYSSSTDMVWKQQTRSFNGKQFNVISNAECSALSLNVKTGINTYVTLVLGYK